MTLNRNKKKDIELTDEYILNKENTVREDRSWLDHTQGSAILDYDLLQGATVVVGQLNLGGSLDLIYDAINIAETAVEKGATTLLIPLNARKQLNELSDDMITKINIQYYTDLKECLLKALAE
jgi:predicted ATP-dependent Lon-type protease